MRTTKERKANAYGLDWTNLDLSGQDGKLHLLDGWTFDTFMLEAGNNCRELTREAIAAEFETLLRMKVDEARDVFRANLGEIERQLLADACDPVAEPLPAEDDMGEPYRPGTLRRFPCSLDNPRGSAVIVGPLGYAKMRELNREAGERTPKWEEGELYG